MWGGQVINLTHKNENERLPFDGAKTPAPNNKRVELEIFHSIAQLVPWIPPVHLGQHLSLQLQRTHTDTQLINHAQQSIHI